MRAASSHDRTSIQQTGVEEIVMRNAGRLATIALIGLPALALAADAPRPVPRSVAALQQCRTIADAALRVACYDKAVDALNAATAANELVMIERTEVRKARKGLFGFTVPSLNFLSGRRDNAEDRADESELETTIVSARSIGYDKWRFSVEGGGTWETVESDSGFDTPKPGAKVLLQKGSLGAYYAKIGKGRRVQAKRVG